MSLLFMEFGGLKIELGPIHYLDVGFVSRPVWRTEILEILGFALRLHVLFQGYVLVVKTL